VNVHNRSEPYDGGQHMEIADDEADGVLGRRERPVEAFGFQFLQKLLSRFGKGTAADHIDVAAPAIVPRPARVVGRGKGMMGEKGQRQKEKKINTEWSGECLEHG